MAGIRKPHGNIKYYRKTNNMEANIEEAIRLYSGDKPFALFVDKLPRNIRAMNKIFDQIKDTFEGEKIENFSKLPKDEENVKMFIKLFNDLTSRLNSAITQGFTWEEDEYEDSEDNGLVKVAISEEEYNVLLQRYKEISPKAGDDAPAKDYEIDFDIIESSSKIADEYINNNFGKYLKAIYNSETSNKDLRNLKNTLHKSFSSLEIRKQEVANMVLNDLVNGDLEVVDGWELNDYINSYSASQLNKQIDSLVEYTGIDEGLLRKLLGLKLNNSTIDEYGRLDKLKDTADYEHLTKNLSALLDEDVFPYVSVMYLDFILRKFITEESFDIEEFNEKNYELILNFK